MKKYTLKQLKSLVNNSLAVDLTKGNNDTYKKIIKKESYLSQVGYASGIYGLNGKLLKGDNTGTLYAITARSSALYIF